MRTRLIAAFGLAGFLVGCGESKPDTSCKGPGTICTWAGTGERAFNGDGLALTETAFYWPMDVEFASDGVGYVLDWNNHRVRRVNPDGRVETVIGTDYVGDGPVDQSDLRPEGASGRTVELNHPTDIQFLPDGTLLLAAWHNHKLRRWDPATGLVHVVCGGGPGGMGDQGPAAQAQLNQPKAIAVDAVGNVFVADSRNQRVRRIDGAKQTITTAAGSGKKGFGGDGGAPLEALFAMQVIDENPEPGGGIALDAQGRLYVSDTFNNRVRRVDFAANTVETVAGHEGDGYGGDGGAAVDAALSLPRDIEIGPDGRLYIADTGNHRIRAVDLSTGVITTVAGNGVRGDAGDGGPATAAELDRPFGIAFDREGNMFVSDTFNSRIRKVVR